MCFPGVTHMHYYGFGTALSLPNLPARGFARSLCTRTDGSKDDEPSYQ
jgi:hypothetical protein